MLDTRTRSRLVVSAVNITEGGPLTILREAMATIRRDYPDWQVYALVNRTGLFDASGVEEIVHAQAKRSWIRRLWCEWVVMNRISRRIQPEVWLSLHDMTPRVQARRRYVYCHNPSPFSRIPLALRLKDRTFLLFSLFYGWLYRINIHRNDAVIVQQEWLREEFRNRFGVRRVIVAHPSVRQATVAPAETRAATRGPFRFLFPTLARVHKNLELIIRCAKILDADPTWKGRIVVTMDGSESAYARSLVEACGATRSVDFIGLQKPVDMDRQYAICDALLFPSLLETWGLPLTEAKARGIPILAADLPYARETVGTCGAVRFFDPHDPQGLAELLIELSSGRSQFEAVQRSEPEEPFADGWRALLKILLVDDAASTSGQAGRP